MTEEAPAIVCERHPTRAAGIVCQRCDSPMCPECMTQASVGWHCPDCVASHTRQNRPATQALRTAMHGHQPIATLTIMVTCGLVFLWDAVSGSNALSGGGGPAGDALALWAPAMEFSNEWYRAISTGFVHSGLIHIGFNMWLLWQLGQMLEGRLGWKGFVPMYVAGLLGGSLGALLGQPLSAAVGASGAVFALMGVLAVLQRAAGQSLMQGGLGGLLLLNVLFSFRAGVSWGGHFGGLAIGVIMGGLLVLLQRAQPSRANLAPAVFAGLGLLCAVGIVFAVNRAVGLL